MNIPSQHIQSLGFLLSTYESDLNYMLQFQQWKQSGFADSEAYALKTTGSLKAFIDEFRVARNINKDNTLGLLNETQTWLISTENQNDVAAFELHLKAKGITHGKVATSMASKILFLNNPGEILPIDTLTKKALKYKEKDYKGYSVVLADFIQNNREQLTEELNSVLPHLINIETAFKNKLYDLETIRFNRYVDKILWTKK